MPHKFEGNWTVFETAGVNPPTEKDRMHLFINDAGVVDEAKSRHGQSRVRGNATANTLRLERLDNGNTRKFDGQLCLDVIINTNRQVMVITGKFVDIAKAKAQTEGVWVIVKP
ncbi:MAG TPA: hypothetical protein VJT15_22855 [Pyrinomonadaceae bacterium]|nr:hypothetical protein [Pyrinomonadaceae bacterium]